MEINYYIVLVMGTILNSRGNEGNSARVDEVRTRREAAMAYERTCEREGMANDGNIFKKKDVAVAGDDDVSVVVWNGRSDFHFAFGNVPRKRRNWRFRRNDRVERVRLIPLKMRIANTRRKGSDDDVAPASKLPTFCFECNALFKSAKMLERHNAEEHRRNKIFPCLYSNCALKFSQITSLRQHQRREHGRVKRNPRKGKFWKNKLTCYVCSVKFGKMELLEKHFRKAHADMHPYKCDVCGTSFKERKNCRRHEECYHTLAKIRCKHCNRTFKRADYAQKHERGCQSKILKRTKEKIKIANAGGGYRCKWCDRTFLKKKYRVYYTHIKHHKNHLNCPVCGRGFSIKKYNVNDVKDHVKLHHAEEYDNVDFQLVAENKGKEITKESSTFDHEEEDSDDGRMGENFGNRLLEQTSEMRELGSNSENGEMEGTFKTIRIVEIRNNPEELNKDNCCETGKNGESSDDIDELVEESVRNERIREIDDTAAVSNENTASPNNGGADSVENEDQMEALKASAILYGMQFQK